ncbi:MAG TPA: DeoR/GlpR family DNA-binding transcription regulator [Propionibacteriaceae bacterium]|nr:DeoR/GlpR family DNA-binding transcription regulator [Propionibacteriaceae bacterium]
MTVQSAQAVARYQAITDLLAADGRVDVVDIANRLGVAQETIRRDLRAMENAGKLQRVHGGAVRIAAGPLALLNSPPPAAQNDLDLTTLVWEQLPRRGTILLGTGSLTLALAHVIVGSPPDEHGLTVATNSLDAAIVLSRASRVEVYNIGGTVSPVTRAQEGDWAVHEMERLHVDVSVVNPAGVSLERGLTEATPAAAAVSQAVVAAGEKVIALAGRGSFGVSAFVQFASIDEINAIAVAGSPSQAALQPFRERGITITVGGSS